MYSKHSLNFWEPPIILDSKIKNCGNPQKIQLPGSGQSSCGVAGRRRFLKLDEPWIDQPEKGHMDLFVANKHDR